MLNGTTDVKEQGALGLGEAIKLSSKESLQVNVVAITGPLIRAVGERFVGNVKAAVIETLAILLDKVIVFRLIRDKFILVECFQYRLIFHFRLAYR